MGNIILVLVLFGMLYSAYLWAEYTEDPDRKKKKGKKL